MMSDERKQEIAKMLELAKILDCRADILEIGLHGAGLIDRLDDLYVFHVWLRTVMTDERKIEEA